MTRASFPVVVHVLLLSKSRLFLLRRANTGFMDGYYGLPGGHQHHGENVSEAALRECEEETGVRPEEIRPVCVMPYRAGRHQGLNFVFEAVHWHGTPGLAEPELFDRAEWFFLDGLPDPHPPWIVEALELRARQDWFREYVWD